MAASSNDKFLKSAPNWTGAIGSGGVADASVTTIPLVSTTSLPTDTGVAITIDRVDANGTLTPSKMEESTGVVSGNNLISCIRGVGGTAQAHSAGAIVEVMLTSAQFNNEIDAILVEHGQDGKQKLDTDGTLTANSDTKIASQKAAKTYANMFNLSYQRDVKFVAKTVAAAADRYTILSPNKMLVLINSVQYYLPAQVALDLSVQATWDSIGTDYRTAANRIGKDFYIYACVPATGLAPDIKVSVNASAPTGYDTTTSLKIGGFHCLGIAVGAIAGHTLTNYAAGDILPQSVWDLKFKPQSAPEGMVYDSGSGKWVDIYLVSVAGAELASIYGGTIADGTSATKFHWYKFSQWLTRLKKKLPDQVEFMSLSLGANQSTNITGNADPTTTGGHVDSAGRRMISNIGCEDTCGVLWQWGRERGGGQSAAAYVNAYDANDAGVGGQGYLVPNAALLGGSWPGGVSCGSRSAAWIYAPLILGADLSARGVSEPVVGF